MTQPGTGQRSRSEAGSSLGVSGKLRTRLLFLDVGWLVGLLNITRSVDFKVVYAAPVEI
jgi:hypothetical protein